MGNARLRIAVCAIVFVACGGTPPPVTDTDAGPLCTSDTACDDGRFCNGVEHCAPTDPAADARGCTRDALPCMPSMVCSEAEARCITVCALEPDADGDGALALACGGTDCDDADAQRAPGLTEVCDADGRDEDCDPTTFGTRDRDGDGHTDALCCNTDMAGATHCGDDCADQRRDVHPGLPEVCDALDQDCDGAIDEAVRADGFHDGDYDGRGDDAMPVVGCPGDAAFARVGGDCDDADPARHTGQLEICDTVDNDCDGTVDESPVQVVWYRDADADGFGTTSDVTIACIPPVGYALRSSDCDDTDPDVSPAAHERCDGRDDDCDGRADYLVAAGDTEDDDGDGAADRTCGGADCDDARADVFPGAPELADGIDDDCDGVVDGTTTSTHWYLDRDGDGYGDESAGSVDGDTPVAGRVTRGGDCDDGDVTVRPGVFDACGGADADCSGVDGDTDLRFAFFADGDHDGWGIGDAASVVIACVAPAGDVGATGDCDDADPRLHPTADETCDSVDEDCDALVDEDAMHAWYLDGDADGYGADATSMIACAPPSGYVAQGGDCEDALPAVHPGASERCDALDQDCDAAIDEGASASCTVAGGTGACVAGACTIASCAAGRGDCDLAYASGCEIDTDHSAGHCGGCGTACGLSDTCGRGTAGTCDASALVGLAGMGAAGAGYDGASFFALRGTGGAVSWGSNVGGALGHGGGGDVPGALPSLDYLEIRGGAYHACGRVRDGRVYCWGSNSDGQLGSGGIGGGRVAPDVVPLPADAIGVGAGGNMSCALLSDGHLYCWGRVQPTRTGAPALVPTIDDAVALSVGIDFACALRPAAGGGREVWCWGTDNGNGACGGCANCCSENPRQVTGLPSDVVSLGQGAGNHMCAITGGGAVLCWGAGPEIGTGIVGCGCPTPTPVALTSLASGVIAVAQGASHDCALLARSSTSSEIWCWGASDGAASSGAYGIAGQTTRGTTPIHAAPTITDARAIAVGLSASAYGDTCVLRADGQVYCFGTNQDGALGNGLCTTARIDPTVPELPVCGIP